MSPAHPHGWSLWVPSPPPPVLTVCLCSQQMDDAVYTFETLLHQELGKLQGKDDLCKSIQRILERVLKVRGGGSGPSVAFPVPRASSPRKRPGVTLPILTKVFWGNTNY